MAHSQGWATTGGSDGKTWELQATTPDRIFIYSVNNRTASITTGALAARETYGLSGAGYRIGIWDAGLPLPNHVEYAGRTIIGDNSSFVSSHATKVLGTVISSGVSPEAQGGAPAAVAEIFDWNKDIVEMLNRGMATPGEAGKLQISNNSYDYSVGWSFDSYPPRWIGDINNGESEMFGSYDANASKWDDVCRQRRYLLPIKSAGNDRADTGPIAGIPFQYWDDNRWVTKNYDPATDPKKDGQDNGGFDTLPVVSTAKNPLTVGAVKDGVYGTDRSPAHAKMTTFSSWGPTDDGRIKPDVVANGWKLYTTSKSGTSAYSNISGTSIASANAAGSALLIIEDYERRFPGETLLAASLKGLILHTADDLDNPGPDYKTGWGLMNVKAATDFLKETQENPATPKLIVDTISETTTNQHLLEWNDTDPIKVTVTWTDPAAPSSNFALDDRTSKLVHDLDITVTSPSGAVYRPYMLDPANPAAVATTGDNNVDNIEQVFIANPGEAGIYVVNVTVDGQLAEGAQEYTVLISGSTETAQQRPEPLVTLTVDPFSASTGTVSANPNGPEYNAGTEVTVTAGTYIESSTATRYTPVGFQGTGSAPAAGNQNNVTFTLDADSHLTWLWTTEYTFKQRSQPAGVVNSTRYYHADTAASTQVLPNEVILEGTLHYLSHWTVDGEMQVDADGLPLSTLTGVLMDQPKTAIAVYRPMDFDGDNDEIHDHWEWVNFGTTSADLSKDSDGDGFTDAQEFVTQTDPHDRSDFFFLQHKTLLITEPPVITWNCKSGCTYTIYKKADITSDEWIEVDSDEIQTIGDIAEWLDPDYAKPGEGSCFYRIDVKRTPGSEH